MRNNNSQRALYIIGIGLGIIFLSAFVTSQLIFPVLFGRARNIEVPNLVGSNISAARRSMQEKGLHVIVRDSVYSETERIETILEQYPKEGKRLKPEGVVYVVVSIGSKMVPVPSVVGSTFTEAYLTLRNSGLRGSVADSLYSESYQVNTVIRSSPSVGSKIEKGKTVKLYLSRGPEPPTAPPDTTFVDEEDYLF